MRSLLSSRVVHHSDLMRYGRRSCSVYTSKRTIQIPERIPYHKLILERCRVLGDRTALVDGDSGQSHSYGELERDATRLASALHKRGFQKGQVYCTYTPNSLELVVTVLGVSAAGGVVTMANPNMTSEELVRNLLVSKASYLHVQSALAKTATSALKSYQHIKPIDVIYQNKAPPSGGINFWSLVAEGDLELPKINFKPKEDVCLMPFSSGTTGLPKGTMISHYGTVTAMESLRLGVQKLQNEGDHVIAVFPFFHVAGAICELFNHLNTGCTIHTRNKFDFDNFLHDISEYKPHTLLIPPPVLRLLAYDTRLDKYDVSSIKRICVGAASAGPNIQRDVKARLNLDEVGQMYGMTELGNIVYSAMGYADVPSSSIGYPVPNVEAKVVDPDSGRILPKCTPGELHIRCPSVMLGYIGNKKATAEVMDDDGWIHTGDLASMDERGHMCIEGRLKDIITTYGFQVSPDELEDALLKHPDVIDSGVIGIPDEKAGEVPRAYVVLKHGAKTTEKELQDFIASKVIYYKHLRGGLEFLPSMPVLPSGKILRRTLREEAKRH